MAAPDMLKSLGPDVRQLKLNGHVGFDSLPDQLVNKAVTQGFNFNILCIGETGVGKSTLMETLFNQRFEFCPSSHDLPAVKLKSVCQEIKESNVKLKLTIVETGGFGDQINKDESTKNITEYIDMQYENYLQEELKIRRSLHTFQDTRIHCALYFISPTGHSLKSVDLVTLRELAKKVNIIPIIAKSDTITKAELSKFKSRIMSEIQSSDIDIYQFPLDDDTVAEQNGAMNAYVPFAVVGSNDEMKPSAGGKALRVRQYAWGTVQVENESHCDFVRLREALVRTNMEDLRDRTHSRHYEVYRRQRLQDMGFRDEDKLSLQEMYERRRETHMAELQRKEEDMRQMFVLRVKEKEGELKEAEKELQARFESVKKQHAEKKRELEEKRRQLDDSSAELERRRAAAEQARHSALLKNTKKK